MNFLTKQFKKPEVVTKTANKEATPTVPKAVAKPMQTKEFDSEEKMKSSKFRMLNEMFYTTHSNKTGNYFKKNKEDFQLYHEGFANQASKWPINPNDMLVKELKKEKYEDKVIFDLGCGEALIQSKLKKEKVKRVVKSFDLVALNDKVIECDISKLPEENDSCDVGIFCLSLMGLNFMQFIIEANRVLKTKGILMVVEIVSRIKNEKLFLKAFSESGFDLRKEKEIKGYFKLFVFKKEKNIHYKKNENSTNKDSEDNNDLALNEEIDSDIKNIKHAPFDVFAQKLISKYKNILSPCLYKKR